MSANVTGLKVTELGTMTDGTTGSMFHIVSSAGNSYKMYERDFYSMVNRLHISGEYTSKAEDWRFIHKSGTEKITGAKTFVNPTTFAMICNTCSDIHFGRIIISLTVRASSPIRVTTCSQSVDALMEQHMISTGWAND